MLAGCACSAGPARAGIHSSRASRRRRCRAQRELTQGPGREQAAAAAGAGTVTVGLGQRGGRRGPGLAQLLRLPAVSACVCLPGGSRLLSSSLNRPPILHFCLKTILLWSTSHVQKCVKCMCVSSISKRACSEQNVSRLWGPPCALPITPPTPKPCRPSSSLR